MSEKTNKKNKNTEEITADYDDIPLTAQKILDSIISSNENYSYDVYAQPVYKQYADMYKNEASLAAKDVFGLATSLTGGYGNSYAATASSQAAQKVYDQLPTKVQELEEKAYERHLSENESKYDILNALKLVDTLQSNSEDASFDKAKFFAEYGDTTELEKLGVNLDTLKYEELSDIAETFAKYGDYSLLKQLGMNVDSREYEDKSDMAEFFAKYGDYSLLKQLGVNLDKLEYDDKSDKAETFAKYGDYSLLKQLGVDTSDQETKDLYNRLLLKARYRKYGT